MIVARQFIAWDRSIENPSRRVRCEPIAPEIRELEPSRKCHQCLVARDEIWDLERLPAQ
jgi:hypothetical protein